MKTIKKYTAIRLQTSNVDDIVKVNLTYGEIDGSYYSRNYPKEEFDSEEDALEYAYKTDNWANWLILPFISFNNYEL
jgi:hypothetical protein